MDDRDVARAEYVLYTPCLPQGKHGSVFQKPKFIGRLRITRMSQIPHLLPNLVIGQIVAQLAYLQRWRLMVL
jgi:hypothetical protein